MRVWTIQPLEVFNNLMKDGVYICDKTKSSYLSDELFQDTFTNAYNWLNEKMIEKIGNPPEGVEYPVWAWYKRYNKHKKPDLRNVGLGTPGEDSVCIELEIPDSDVVLSDFDAWHSVLNNWYIDDSTNEKEYDEMQARVDALPRETKKKEIKKSWNKIFDISYLDTDWRANGIFVQATFWILKKEYIVNYWKFKAR